MRDINACAFTSFAFHPKAEMLVCPDSYREIWQVFWLGVHFNAFPYLQWRRLKLLAVLLSEAFGRPLTATGIAPDFHRTSLLIC